MSVSALFLGGEKKELFRKEKIRKILIIRIDRIGDIVLSTPAIRALKENFPQAHIAIMVNPYIKELIVENPYLNEIIVYDEKGRQQRFLSRISFIKNLRKKKFDLALDLLLSYKLKTALLAYLSGARYRVGFDIEGRGAFFNIKVAPDKKVKHLIEYTMDLVKAIGADTAEMDPEIFVSSEDNDYIRDYLNRNIAGHNLVVGIHPGGYYPSQRWMVEGFAQLADELIRRYQAEVVITGGPAEEGLVLKIANLMKEKAVFMNRISLGKLMALISQCSLFICNNSGPLHIAVALKVPTVSTMGPTIPEMWWPRGDNHIVLRKDLPCSPCSLGECKTHECMKLITLEDILQAVQVQLRKLKKGCG